MKAFNEVIAKLIAVISQSNLVWNVSEFFFTEAAIWFRYAFLDLRLHNYMMTIVRHFFPMHLLYDVRNNFNSHCNEINILYVGTKILQLGSMINEKLANIIIKSTLATNIEENEQYSCFFSIDCFFPSLFVDTLKKSVIFLNLRMVMHCYICITNPTVPDQTCYYGSEIIAKYSMRWFLDFLHVAMVYTFYIDSEGYESSVHACGAIAGCLRIFKTIV